ncbi:hypothetical protein EH30_04520 [Erythrobacter sp. JL475]|nr:hypothetical protein EH30_04520 [Erythrobacter sp. JL475]
MRIMKTRYRLLAGAPGLLLAQGAWAQDPAIRSDPAGESAAEPSEQTHRTLSFSVPLVSETRAFGEVFIEVAADNSYLIDTASFRREIAPILNEEGLAGLDRVLEGQALTSAESLQTAGIDITFDQRRLQLAILGIRPELLAVQQIGARSDRRGGIQLNRIEPARFSSYLNVTGNFDYDTALGAELPSFFLDGATRIGGVVVEYDGAITDQFTGDVQFLRRATRAVYDDPDSYRRYSAGDLVVESLSVLRNPQIGGVAIEKRRRIFDPFLSVTQLGGRQIFLDNRSTVEVRVNGERFDTLQLDAGTYDLANLPIQQGSNDVQLLIRDSFGQERIVDYSFFFENLALPAGEEEYSLAVGVLSRPLGFQQDYTDEVAASGFYRKALSENLVLGAAFQASEDVQTVAGSVSVVPQIIPGVFDLETGVSYSDSGVGIAVRAGFQLQTGNALSNSSQLAINVEYESSKYRTIDLVQPINFDLLSVGASYSRSFSESIFAVVGGSFVRNSGRGEDNYNAFFDVNYRLNNRMRLSAGAEYGSAIGGREQFGVRIGLTWALGGRTRLNADYRSRIDNYRANISRGADNSIGSFGYDAGISQFGDQTLADVQVQYVSNRFAARADVTSSGNSIGDVFAQQRARVQISSAIAFADDTFAIGRPVTNSFAVASSHPALKSQGIVTARTLEGSEYYARSGALGAALQGDLSAYSEQNIQFDAADPEDGFDVGDGVVLVEPPYRSGYKLVIGNEYFVSVIGRLEDPDGPVTLESGTVTSADGDEGFKPLVFFTNRQGRYALFGLAVGKRYRVELPQSGRQFEFSVPEDGGALVRLEPVQVPAVE